MTIATRLFFLAVLLFCSCKSVYKTKIAELEQNNSYRFAFYNAENLFDLVDEPGKEDDAFTPEGKNKWTPDRYQKKLDQLAKVIGAMNYPVAVGLCEVENKTVLQDLIQRTELQKYQYQYVHYDSPDQRGIDVGFLYMSPALKVLGSDITRIDFPPEVVEDYTTRDILHVKTLFRSRDTLHFFINHWPSRRGGLAESQPKRVYVATQLRKETNKLLKANPNSAIIITGDFNDEPDNDSVHSVLNAKPAADDPVNSNLYNCSYHLDQKGKGTYNFRGNWNMLDQFIVSGSLLNNSCDVQVGAVGILEADWLFYDDKKYGKKPNRTYGGPNYYGGFSDHLPVYIEVDIKMDIRRGK